MVSPTLRRPRLHDPTMPVVELPPESRGEAPGRGRMEGRRVLVVGGGQTDWGVDDAPIGNGRAMSVLLAREGARVAVADREAAAAEATVDVIKAEGGGANTVVADVAVPADV